MTAILSESQEKVQSAGKNLLLYTFSMLKTGEIHDLNNEAWIRPSEKLLEALDTIIRAERRSVSFVIHEGIAQINSHALWLDRTTLEQAQELEQYLAKREAGGIIFSQKPSEEDLRKFFFQFARFRAPDDCEDQAAALSQAIEDEGISSMKVAPQPLRLDGIGQGIRGVAALWFYSKGIAGISDLLERRPIEVKVARRTAQQLVDACAVEQDLLVGLTLSGTTWSPERTAVDCAILSASIGRGLGMTAIQCANLATAAILHTVGHAYPNPEPEKISVDDAVASFALRQLVEGSSYTAVLAQRVAAAIEWRTVMTEENADPARPKGPSPHPWSQLLGLCRYFLGEVRIGENGKGRAALEVGLELLASPPKALDSALIHAFIATVGLLPVGTLVKLQNGDLAVVSDVDHLRGRHLYSQRPAPITSPRKIYVERLRDASGTPISERQSRVRLGDDSDEGEWAIHEVVSSKEHLDLVVRALFRRPSTVLTQLGVR